MTPLKTVNQPTLERCRICGHGGLVPYLDLGVTPLANSYLTKDDLGKSEYRVPLVLALCESCGLSQLTEVVEPDLMFRNYLYVSSTSKTFRDHCDELAATAILASGAIPGDRIVDIASNDGYLLSRFKERGLIALGVDPARNLVADSSARGVETIVDYWSVDVALSILQDRGSTRIITATNVLGHVEDLRDFVAGVRAALHRDGVFVLEVPYLLDMIADDEFDTIYHEHLSYFAISPIVRLMAKYDLDVFDVQHFPEIHGGTIRLFVGRHRTPSVAMMVGMMREERFGYREVDAYRKFADRVREKRDRLIRAVQVALSSGKIVWAYGASAKGNTLMNYLGLDADSVPVVIDDNPKKWGLYTPGAHMRIAGPEELARSNVSSLLLLAWNFRDEIVRRCRDMGYDGTFIVP